MKFITLIFLFISWQAQGSVRASVNSNTIGINQSILLSVSADDAATNDPNLSVLKRQFKIIGNTKVSRPYIQNGVRKYKTSWIFILRAKSSGTLLIPSLKINGQKSQPIKVRVKALRQNKKKQVQRKKVPAHDVLVKATIDKAKLYPNEMLTYRLTINYPDERYSNFMVSPPFIAGATVLSLTEASLKKTTERSKTRIIRQQSFAIFADQMALYNIQPAEIRFKQVNAQPNANDIILKANSLHFEIMPKANQTSLGYWLPSKKVTLTEQWQKVDKLSVGSAITRTIKLKVLGVDSDILPLLSTLTHHSASILLKDVAIENIIEDDQLYALRTEKTEYTFNTAGQISVAPIDVHWWNTAANQAKISSLQARLFNITQAIAPELEKVKVDSKKNLVAGSIFLKEASVKEQTPQPDEKASASAEFLSIQQMNWAIGLLFSLLVATTSGWLFSVRKTKASSA